jgi:hypothetical protein
MTTEIRMWDEPLATLLGNGLIPPNGPISALYMHDRRWWGQLQYLMGCWLAPEFREIIFSVFWREEELKEE